VLLSLLPPSWAIARCAPAPEFLELWRQIAAPTNLSPRNRDGAHRSATAPGPCRDAYTNRPVRRRGVLSRRNLLESSSVAQSLDVRTRLTGSLHFPVFQS